MKATPPDLKSYFPKEITSNIHNFLSPQLAKRWQSLTARQNDVTFLHLPEWYEAYLASYHLKKGQGKTIFVEVLWDSQCVAVFPMLHIKKRIGLKNLYILELMWPTDLGVRDCIVGDQEILQDVFESLVNALKNGGVPWDVLLFPDIVEQSAAFRISTSQKLYHYTIRHHHYTARIRVEGDGQSCLSFLSSRMRKRLKTYYNNLSKNGKIRFQLTKDQEITEELFEAFLDVEAKSWKGESGTRTALKFDNIQQQFYRQLFFSKAEGRMIATLYLDGCIIAANLCLVTGDTLNMLKISYSQEFAKDFPGMLLLRYLIEQSACNDKINYIAFVTSPTWAERWHPEILKVYLIKLYNHTLAGNYVRGLDNAVQCARHIKSKRNSLQEWFSRFRNKT